MEQLFTFIGIIFACVLAVIIESPILFGVSFAGGILYHILRGKIKGWSLPKDVKDRHSW
jgi:hypothetical protein